LRNSPKVSNDRRRDGLYVLSRGGSRGGRGNVPIIRKCNRARRKHKLKSACGVRVVNCIEARQRGWRGKAERESKEEGRE